MTTNDPLFFPLLPRTVLRVSGPDRVRFLNGQLTQDVRRATGSQAVFSCVLNAKGQLDAVCWVREHEDSYLLDAPRDLREGLQARLDRYLIADDAELADESDDWHFTLLRGKIEVPMDVPVYDIDRTGAPAHEALTRSPLDLEGVEAGTGDQLENERIANGFPRWGAELTAGLLPPDAGLDAIAVSYDKGCYLGQEVISRMKRAGKTNQHLVRLSVPAGTKPPCLLIHEDKQAGRVTSVAAPAEGATDSAALGFRKRKFSEIAQFLLRDEAGTPIDGTARVLEARDG